MCEAIAVKDRHGLVLGYANRQYDGAYLVMVYGHNPHIVSHSKMSLEGAEVFLKSLPGAKRYFTLGS